MFLEARFQTMLQADDYEGDPTHETWQVWCKGSYGRMTALVEVTAPRDVLPLACLVQAYRRIGQEVTINRTPSLGQAIDALTGRVREARGGFTIQISPLKRSPPKEVKP